jgi:hypothetical protein
VPDDDATRMSNVSSFASLPPRRVSKAQPAAADERTRAVDIRNDSSISDVDWDLD